MALIASKRKAAPPFSNFYLKGKKTLTRPRQVLTSDSEMKMVVTSVGAYSMDVEFRTKKLKAEYLDSRKAAKSYGQQVGRKYVLRINLIKKARDLAEIKRLPGLRCHELKGKRKGQYAVDLTGFYRLIFTLKGSILDIVRIEEVSKHYDD